MTPDDFRIVCMVFAVAFMALIVIRRTGRKSR
jgi:hypothetical protein